MCFPALPAEETKRGILTNLAKVYDPLGIVSPVMLEGKLLYRNTCSLDRRDSRPVEKVGEGTTEGGVGETQHPPLPGRDR